MIYVSFRNEIYAAKNLKEARRLGRMLNNSQLPTNYLVRFYKKKADILSKKSRPYAIMYYDVVGKKTFYFDGEQYVAHKDGSVKRV